MNTKIKKLLKGKTVTLKDNDIVKVAFHVPNLSIENYKKLEKAYEKGKGCRIKLSDMEMHGSGLVNEIQKDVKKVGNFALKSGIADIAIDEAVNLAPIPAIGKKVASKLIKNQVHKMTGTGVLHGGALLGSDNPYLPSQLSGKI